MPIPYFSLPKQASSCSGKLCLLILMLVWVGAVAKAQTHEADARRGLNVSAAELPDAPLAAAPARVPEADLMAQASSRVISPVSQSGPVGTLSEHERFVLYIHRTYGPPGFVLPAFEAAIAMADPPDKLPREWRDGAGGFGRHYGAFVVRHTAGGTADYLVTTALREDPRYFPAEYGGAERSGVARRVLHAMTFAFVDRTDSGRATPAFGNFAGALTAGFIGNAYQPEGFNDRVHGGQRTIVDFSTYIGRNLISEFSPELLHLAHKLHLAVVPNNDHPLWWHSY